MYGGVIFNFRNMTQQHNQKKSCYYESMNIELICNMKQFRLNGKMLKKKKKPEIKINAIIEYHIKKLGFLKFISKNKYFVMADIIKNMCKKTSQKFSYKECHTGIGNKAT